MEFQQSNAYQPWELICHVNLDLYCQPSGKVNCWKNKKIGEKTPQNLSSLETRKSKAPVPTAVAMEDEEEAAKRARLSADNDSAMGDLDPRTRPAVPGSSCEYCIEKVRLESEMVKSRVKLEGLF
ncbi:hypothetical protein AVEN_26923-1 [Araneus ventricosus]|uniref:Uncharacterized protein n=1 Tax=Araneus ventricosus TaxID=182803 RepID=A0A4Y2RY90_ARAVE|nr:hypothetical protein AVEN_26923-1 [Araneus ventricosus]